MIQQDPRTKNQWFNSSSMTAYFKDYKSGLQQALDTVSNEQLEATSSLMQTVAARKGVFFIAGNGGSAAIAEHLCCDWTKGTYSGGENTLRTHSLVSKSALMTALANDFGYDEVFAHQLEMQATEKDALFVISSSGNSANIIRAIEVAKKLSLPVIALTGFSGGEAKAMADVPLHVEFNNYAVVEDAHQTIIQSLAQYFFAAKTK